MKIKPLTLKKGMREPNAKTQSFFNTDRVKCQIAPHGKKKYSNGKLENEEKKIYIYILYR